MKRRGNVISPVDSINTLAEMLVGTDFTVEDGEQVYVRLTQQWFVYRVNSGLTADGINVIAPAYGNGVWELLNTGPGGANAGLGPFNTIATGAVGSGRLLDVTAGQLALLKRGNVAWVESVKDFWRWAPTSVLTADNITVCNPTANGANPGRFVRELVAAPEWMSQTTWIIDGANSTGLASDENNGSTATTPLLTDAERQRRVNAGSIWNAGAYHLRYISDVASADTVRLLGIVDRQSAVFVHGSLVDGQGQSTLFTGAVDALTAQNPATNTPYQVTSNALPVSWTASGLVDARCRRTNSTAIKFWPIKDQGAKQARMSNTMQAFTYAIPFANPVAATAPVIALNDTFVVETLTSIRLIEVMLQAVPDSSVNTFSVLVVFESLQLGRLGATNGRLYLSTDARCVFDGCSIWNPISAKPAGGTATVLPVLEGCSLRSGVPFPLAVFKSGYCQGALTAQYASIFLSLGLDFIVQGGACTLQTLGQHDRFAVFDSTAQGVVFAASLTEFFVASGVTGIWGSGNVSFAVDIQGGALVRYVAGQAAAFTIAGGGATDFRIAGVTTVRPFDIATGAYLATTTLTWAHLAAAVGGGTGFGGNVNDPVSQGAIVAG